MKTDTQNAQKGFEIGQYQYLKAMVEQGPTRDPSPLWVKYHQSTGSAFSSKLIKKYPLYSSLSFLMI